MIDYTTLKHSQMMNCKLVKYVDLVCDQCLSIISGLPGISR